jgi:hypothetical protein
MILRFKSKQTRMFGTVWASSFVFWTLLEEILFGKDRVDILESDSAEKKHKPHSKQTLLLSPSLSFLCFLML